MQKKKKKPKINLGFQRVTWCPVETIPAKKMICPAPMQEVRLTRM